MNTFGMWWILTGDTLIYLAYSTPCWAWSESVCEELKSVSTSTQRHVPLIQTDPEITNMQRRDTQLWISSHPSKISDRCKLVRNKSGGFMILFCLMKVHHSTSTQTCIIPISMQHVSAQKNPEINTLGGPFFVSKHIQPEAWKPPITRQFVQLASLALLLHQACSHPTAINISIKRSWFVMDAGLGENKPTFFLVLSIRHCIGLTDPQLTVSACFVSELHGQRALFPVS